MDKALLKEKAVEATKVIAFIILFFVLLKVVSVVFFPQSTATKYDNRQKDAYSFLNENENTIQIVGLGNSDLYSGFSPLDLWNKYGFTSTVCASPRQTFKESKEILETLFEKQSPELVIIETDMFYDHNLKSNAKTLGKLKNSSKIFEKMDPEHFDNKFEKWFSVFRFHNYWMGSNGKSLPFNTHGYKYNNTEFNVKNFDYMKKTDKTEPLSEFNTQQADMLIDYCKENNADVLLVMLPSIRSWNYARYSAVKEYAEERALPFLDLNFCYDEIGIDVNNCYRDNGNHLNYDGAKKATEYIGEYISKNYSIKSMANNSKYDNWKDSVKAFEKYRKNEEK